MTVTERSATLPEAGLLIGEEWRSSGSGGTFEHSNPASGQVQATIPLAGEAEVAEAATVARAAFPAWRKMDTGQRRDILLNVATAIRRDLEQFAVTSALELGSPIATAAMGASALADWFTYSAGWVDKLTGEVIPGANFDYTLVEPYGTIGAIVPWNAPLVVGGAKVAPALAAGNCVILKPPELAPFGCMEFARLALEAGLPPGVLQVLPGGPAGGEALVKHPLVHKISFTGGPVVGARVAALAGEALKPVVLELGGKSANIIFEDANLDEAVPLSVSLMSVFTGQGCALPSRLLVQDGVYDEVLERAKAVASAITVGDPFDAQTVMGPIQNAAHLNRVLGMIKDAVDTKTGRLIAGGDRLGGDLASGYYLPVTIFGDVDNDSRLAQEEIFGPVLSIIRFSSEDEAVQIANETAYGLAAYIQTNDLRRAHRVAAELDAGFVSINSFPVVTPATPFGGFGSSGFGKEGGRAGIGEFLRIKNVTAAL